MKGLVAGTFTITRHDGTTIDYASEPEVDYEGSSLYRLLTEIRDHWYLTSKMAQTST